MCCVCTLILLERTCVELNSPEKARRGRHAHSETRCTFVPDPSSSAPRADGLVPHLTDPDVIHGMDEDDPLEMSVSTAMDDVLDFGPWVNQVSGTRPFAQVFLADSARCYFRRQLPLLHNYP